MTLVELEAELRRLANERREDAKLCRKWLTVKREEYKAEDQADAFEFAADLVRDAAKTEAA